MNSFGKNLLCLAAVLIPGICTTLYAENDVKEIKVLAIGNSFSQDANVFREDINAADPGNKLLVTIAYIGGCSIQKHLSLALKNEADPDNLKFRCYHDPQFMPKGDYGLKDMLSFTDWKYVTIQQVSCESDNVNKYRPYAAELCKFIKKYCPGAEIVIHETWADRIDNPRLKQFGKTQTEMYKNLHSAYMTIAAELGNLGVIPVGSAFQKLGEDPDFKFVVDDKFNFKHPVYPKLPDQTNALCIGWLWRKDPESGKFKLDYDHHATPVGSYLAALVWRQFFFPDIDIRKNTFSPENISPENAWLIRDMAYRIVKQGNSPESEEKR